MRLLWQQRQHIYMGGVPDIMHYESKGDKRREMSDDDRLVIVDALLKFEPNDILKIFDREHFYYNKQQHSCRD